MNQRQYDWSRYQDELGLAERELRRLAITPKKKRPRCAKSTFKTEGDPISKESD
jgi:hypothetical protein